MLLQIAVTEIYNLPFWLLKAAMNTRTEMRCFYSVLLLGVLLIAPGCGEGDPLSRQRVSGEIKLDGAPLANGTIAFSPTDPKGTSSGASITDGKYEIPAEKGLPPGDYLVRITASDDNAQPVEAPGESNNIAVELIPAEYNTESTQKFTVKAGAENLYNLNITSR